MVVATTAFFVPPVTDRPAWPALTAICTPVPRSAEHPRPPSDQLAEASMPVVSPAALTAVPAALNDPPPPPWLPFWTLTA